MKLTLARDALAGALAQITRIVERRNTIPILGNVLLRAADSRLSLTGTDLDVEVATSIACDVVRPGAATVQATALHDIAKKLAGSEVALEVTDESTQPLVIRSGRSRFKLPTLPDADFPSLAAPEADVISVPAKALAGLIDQVSFAISTEETRYYLNGIYLHITQVDGTPWLTGVATDGHRLAQRRLAAPEGHERWPEPGIIVPRKAVAELAKLLPTVGDGPARLVVSPTKLQVQMGDTRLVTKLVDGTYPDYSRVIPAPGAATRVTMDRKDLIAATARVTTVSSDRGRAVKFSFEEEASRAVLSVTNPDAGAATDEIETTHAGPPLQIGFNGAYVGDVAGALSTDTITLEMADPGAPARIIAEGDVTAVFVLMPMRV
ncbi:DNA polymerase-3 subunit beta [Azorhizobium sp. AG788]|uniref:DNA polymerase III subunit beta n=1 Tax=Azorhizobium sp. AG788 TaxID=2183897 RepID=UPI00105D5B46|nr:DNA polymerase III subunit beta [Azorhizobium sp. AG788]TDT94516.1 DNA polymerase-3 subunit beta [Azorhizobium sp. AG788]